VRVVVNGEPTSVRPGTRLGEVVHAVCSAEGGVSVALNREVVPRSQWSVTSLRDDDTVEVLRAAQGG